MNKSKKKTKPNPKKDYKEADGDISLTSLEAELQRIIKEDAERRVKLIPQQKKQKQINSRLPPQQSQAECSRRPQARITFYKRVYSDPTLIEHFLNSTGCQSYSHLVTTDSACQLLELPEDSPQFIEIKKSFTSTNKKTFSIKQIQMIINPYLMMQYELMRERYRQLYGQVTEKLLFHGTKKTNMENICKYNFDWRLKGTARGHKFGQGVSFTPLANYATHYGDKTYNKIMFVASVIVSSTCVGNPSTVIPSRNCDTTTNERKQVYVKYEDNAFYPFYLIHYKGSNNCKKKKKKSVS